MFKKGDVLQNKSGNSPIRLLTESYFDGFIVGTMEVQYTGFIMPAYEFDSIHYQNFYYKIPYWKWLRISILHTIKRFFEMLKYRRDKELGLVNLISSSKYWDLYPVEYKIINKPVISCGYIAHTKASKELQLPFWREEHFSDVDEVHFGKWLLSRLKHILPSALL